jgi:tellurite resistance protein TerC
MAKALSLVDRHSVEVWLHDGLRYTLETAFQKDNSYTLFRYEDWPAWVIFTSIFLTLIIFDNAILNRNPAALTVTRAVCYTLFWVVVAGGFCGWVAWWYSPAAAYMWWSGYMLEWMLSFDNLFVFHLVFTSYACPNYLKHRPLFFGIVGAVVMRLVFIFAGQFLMHAMGFMHLVFGAFLIYTGIQTVLSDDDEDDPSQQPMVLWLQNHMKFVNVYDSNGAFFVKCPVKDNGEPDIPEDAIVKQEEPTETTPLVEDGKEEKEKHIDVVDFSRLSGSAQRTETRATMLFLVCFCLNLCDLLFAVDSVSAIVAAVNDLFLAYTSAVFAMLGMRAIFFLIDIMVQLFTLLKYGVSFILVFIGVKLIVGKFYHIPSSIVCSVLVGAIGLSMLASVIQNKLEEKYQNTSPMSPEIKDRLAVLKRNSPFPSPMPPQKNCAM